MAGDAVSFSPYRLPALEAGRYRVTARQRVARRDGETFDAFEDTLTVEATGPRFTVTPERIHSRFPAAGSRGDFSGVLPHIVLGTPTLPWLREPARRVPGEARARTTEPWMALLVFDSADPAPAVVTGTLGDLLSCDAYAGWREPEPGERLDDLCQWVDVPAELFPAVAPRADELPWLAHVRTQGEQELAVVVANRLPASHGVTTCCLVSFEDARELLEAGVPGAVRLPVLESWSFSAAQETESFGGLLGRVSTGTLRIPGTQPALAHGYALLEHTMRQGARSASWYRGPLIPAEASGTGAVAPGSDSPDELLRYDPQSGMFDVSLAVAWQLGRLLALADAELSVQIAAWKAGGHRTRAQASDRALLADLLGAEAVAPGADLQAQLAEALVKPGDELLTRR